MIRTSAKRRREDLAVRRNYLHFGMFIALCMIAMPGLNSLAADPVPDTIGAKTTREKKLTAKVSIDSTELSGMMLREILSELKSEVQGAKAGTIRFEPDPKSGITLTTRIKFKADKEPLDVVLDRMFEASGRPWGYYVNVSTKKDDQLDGAIIIVADPTCRGYPPGDPRNKKPEAKKEDPKKGKP
jgi:hypothetical protein